MRKKEEYKKLRREGMGM